MHSVKAINEKTSSAVIIQLITIKLTEERPCYLIKMIHIGINKCLLNKYNISKSSKNNISYSIMI